MNWSGPKTAPLGGLPTPGRAHGGPCRQHHPLQGGRTAALVLDVMRRMKAAVGDTTALYGLICGPFTLASHLRGNDIFHGYV